MTDTKPRNLAGTGFDEVLYDEWIVALESGDYRQTTEMLRHVQSEYADSGNSVTTYFDCCLGVLCDVHLNLRGYEDFGDNYDAIEHAWMQNGVYDDADTILPESVMQRVGFVSGHGAIHGDSASEHNWMLPDEITNGVESAQVHTLVAANDEMRLDFEQIASVLRANKARVMERVAKAQG